MDDMTGLLDAEVFGVRLEEELRRAVRFQRPLALIMAGWSHQGPQAFDKRTVKSYGPVRQIATIIKKSLRDVDAAGRLDGEIVAAVLPETDLAGARIVAERICREAEHYQFPGETLDDLIQLTVNVSIVSHPEHGTDTQVLIAEARVALERAQHDGYGLVYEGERPVTP